jgi:uncharacterized protein
MRGHLDLRLLGKRLYVKGTFAVKVQLICARCLSNFIGKVGDSFEELVELDEENGDPDYFLPIKNNSFDLTPLICEFFWLSWPIRALCRPDCQGLCPNCGANLNEGACFCSERASTRH